MTKSIFSNSFLERRRIARMLRYTSVDLSTADTMSRAERHRREVANAVEALERHVETNPSDWLALYMLVDYYSRQRSYSKAVRASQRCYELRPKDLRSLYSLASSLRMLTWAKLNTPEQRAQLERFFAENGIPAEDRFDPGESQRALDELGMTIQDAARKALSLFWLVKSGATHRDEREAVSRTIEAIEMEFPDVR